MNNLVIPHRTIGEIMMCEEHKNKAEEDIEMELTERINCIMDIYSSDKNHIIWSDMDRFALLIIRQNHVLEREKFDCATDDLGKCEQNYDVLPQPWKNALHAVDLYLYDMLVSKSKHTFKAHLTKLNSECSDSSYTEELLVKFSKPLELDDNNFIDHLLKQIWDKVASEFRDDALQHRMNRIPTIIKSVHE